MVPGSHCTTAPKRTARSAFETSDGKKPARKKTAAYKSAITRRRGVACRTRSRGSPCEPGPDAHARCASSGRRRVGPPVPVLIRADCTSGNRTLLRRQALLEKCDEWRQHLLGRLEVRNVAETRQEQDAAVAVGDGPGEVLHPLLE